VSLARRVPESNRYLHFTKGDTLMADSVEGQTGKPFTMPVELGKIREFARATKSSNPAYDGAPGDTPVSPGTFLITSGFWQTLASSPMANAGVSFDLARLLHGGQEFIFHGPPPRAGDVLTGVSRIDKQYEKEGKRGGTMAFMETVTEYRNQAGELVAEARGTSIITSKSTQGD
jgi:acyl dehydratase